MILRGLSPTHDTILEFCRVAYACDMMCMCVEFKDEILLRWEECKTREKYNFSNKRENGNFSGKI